MTDRLAVLLDKQDIAEIIYRLARAIDRCDPEAMAACYHADATDDHGLIKGSIDDFIAQVMPMLQGMERTQHNITNLLIEVNGGTARSEAYFIAQHTLASETGAGELGKVEMFAAGRYLDRFTRRQGSWKIAHRHAIYDWTMSVPSSGGWDAEPMAALLRRGERGRADPSYAHFSASL